MGTVEGQITAPRPEARTVRRECRDGAAIRRTQRPTEDAGGEATEAPSHSDSHQRGAALPSVETSDFRRGRCSEPTRRTKTTTIKLPTRRTRGAVFPIEGVQPCDLRGAPLELDAAEKAERWSNGDVFLVERDFTPRVDPRTVQFVARS